MRNTTFSTKEEYLAYRKQWKADYKALSETIRLRRLINKGYQRAYGKACAQIDMAPSLGNSTWLERYQQRNSLRDTLLAEDKGYQTLLKKYEPYKDVKASSADATRMLIELKEAKIQAQEQYLAQKAAAVVS
jgi:hypothetical protein